jgi:hypothetical protein
MDLVSFRDFLKLFELFILCPIEPSAIECFHLGENCYNTTPTTTTIIPTPLSHPESSFPSYSFSISTRISLLTTKTKQNKTKTNKQKQTNKQKRK